MASEKDLSLGDFLRQEREHRGITIEQVASATKVGVRTLHALEADLYAELPAKPFVRGFVNAYCRFIGLDSKEVLSRFDDFMILKGTERPNRESGHSGYAFEKKDSDQQSRTILLVAIFGFMIVGGIVMFFLKPSLRRHQSSQIEQLRAAHDGIGGPFPAPSPVPVQSVSALIMTPSPSGFPSPSPSASVVAESQGKEVAALVPSPIPIPIPSSVPTLTPVSAVSTEVSPVASPEPSHIAGHDPADPLDSGRALALSEIRHKAAFKILADVWVRYQVDDRPIRKFIIRKGKMLVLKAKSGIKFEVSNLNSIVFNYNGRTTRVAKSDPHVVMVQNTGGLFFPKELSEDLGSFKQSDADLPKTPNPVPEQSNPDPAPTP